MKKLNNLTLTTTNEVYNFSGEEAESVYKQWDTAITNDWQYVVLKLKGRDIFLNVNHIVEVYCTYVEVNE